MSEHFLKQHMVIGTAQTRRVQGGGEGWSDSGHILKVDQQDLLIDVHVWHMGERNQE